MQIKFIDKGTVIFIYESVSDQEFDTIHEAKFYDIKDETAFYVESAELYNDFNRLREYDSLKIVFLRGPNMYEFTGKIVGVATSGGAYLTQIKQLTGLEASSRRKYTREEMDVNIQIYGLSEESLHSADIKKAHEAAEFTGVTLDISAGGICVVSNHRLDSAYEPYFLVEFALNGKDEFLLPAKLLRKGDCPQTVLYRYDYGFQFLYDQNPEEKNRLTTALFNAKFSLFNRP